MQEAFLRVWERWNKVSAMESPTGYLHHAAMNIFRNRYRRCNLGSHKAIGARSARRRLRVGRGPGLGFERPGEADPQAAGRARADRPVGLSGR